MPRSRPRAGHDALAARTGGDRRLRLRAVARKPICSPCSAPESELPSACRTPVASDRTPSRGTTTAAPTLQWRLDKLRNLCPIVNRSTGTALDGTALDGTGSTAAGSNSVIEAPNANTNDLWTITAS
jgi:hypothetical protein